MYYIIETKYAGPNSEQHTDKNRIEISTEPAMTNMSHQPMLHGWCGTTNDWAVYAHGEYQTIEDARQAIESIFGEVRDRDSIGELFDSDDDAVVEVYRPGKYIPMSRQETADWIYEGMTQDIAADTSDERLTELSLEYEALANDEGYTLHANIIELLDEYRQIVRDDKV